MSDPCKLCNPAIMAERGCCTNNMGEGLKVLKSKSGRRIEVCKQLTKMEDGTWGCGIQLDSDSRPPECSGWSCEQKLLASW